tara:strand:+ start:1108 stop:1293 length:186 start_codon:yes stop_codon:yes gene_type:complete
MHESKNNENNHIILVERSSKVVTCPKKDASGWNSHPKVFLDISKRGQVSCPYCGNVFIYEK